MASHAGAMGARVAARSRRASAPSAAQAACAAAAAKRATAERNSLDQIFRKHDAAGSGLTLSQFSALLAEVDGRPLSEAEARYLLAVADADHNALISRPELDGALRALRALRADEAVVARRFPRYDTNGSGQLERPQLEKLLRDLCQGEALTEHEVGWVFSHADGDSNGAIDPTELNAAIGLVYLHRTKQAEQQEAAERGTSGLGRWFRRAKPKLADFPGAMRPEERAPAPTDKAEAQPATPQRADAATKALAGLGAVGGRLVVL